jgi:hypothetical protein
MTVRILFFGRNSRVYVWEKEKPVVLVACKKYQRAVRHYIASSLTLSPASRAEES